MLTSMLGSVSDSYIKNSSHFKEKIDTHIPVNYILVSFDVVSLFTNVPVSQFLEFLSVKLTDMDFPVPCNNLIKLIDISMKQNVFSFNNNFCRQVFGTGMGSSLSPVIANLYMEFFETQLLVNIPLYSCVSSWF